jgi:MlaC protein
MQSQLVSRIVVFGIALAVTGCASIKLSGEPMMVDQSNYDRLNGSPATTIGTEYTPTESVKNTITDVLSIIGNEALKQPGRSQERRHQIEQVIRHRVNFGQMAQSSLGTPWTRLSDKERQEL